MADDREKERRRRLPESAAVASRHPLSSARSSRSSEELCTVQFAAEQLKLHRKTVLRFIREGRLPATRIGKSYRIRRSDLEAPGGLPAQLNAPVDSPSMTSIVDIPGVQPDLARKWASTITGTLNARPRDGSQMRAEVIYDPDRSHLKIVVVGAPSNTVNLLSMIRVWLEQLRA
jgi:excisionase family DNA binding protein